MAFEVDEHRQRTNFADDFVFQRISSLPSLCHQQTCFAADVEIISA
jgi:hypothetical protein